MFAAVGLSMLALVSPAASVPPPPVYAPRQVQVSPPAPPTFIPAFEGLHPAGILKSPDWSDYHNYPDDAVEKDEEGSVTFGLRINEEGVPDDCTILVPNPSDSLNRVTCKLAMQMRFDPPRDAMGKPLRSVFRTRTTWLLQDPRRLDASAIDADLEIGPSGVLSCKTSGFGPYLEVWRASVCADVPGFLKKSSVASKLGHHVTLSLRVDAGSGLLDQADWPAGALLARDYSTFTINRDGDATECSAEQDGDIFSNDFRSQAPCGRYLSSIWFEVPKKGKPSPRGRYELRLVNRPHLQTLSDR